MKDKFIFGNDSSIGSSCASTSKYHVISKDKKINTLFHIRVIMKQTKMHTLIVVDPKIISFQK